MEPLGQTQVDACEIKFLNKHTEQLSVRIPVNWREEISSLISLKGNTRTLTCRLQPAGHQNACYGLVD